MEKQIYLTLANGRVFSGKSFGAEKEMEGELVFTTAMTGYLETLTDPSYCGQMVVQTFPLIGNYGVIPSDFESARPALKAYIVRQWCQEPSNFRCEGDLDTFLKAQGIAGMYDIDTRELTQLIREEGVMNAFLGFAPHKNPAALKQYRLPRPVEIVTCPERIHHRGSLDGGPRVVLWDFGTKSNILRELLLRSAEVIQVSSGTSAEEIRSLKPDGILLSNGPGDPQDNPEAIQEIEKCWAQQIPTFGICLGHQLLALSRGAQSSKLKYGHRGANQPVKDLDSGRVYMTSQNHGYAVESATLPRQAKVRFVNVNDQTCEGIEYADGPVFSVQFHPEACAGPLDTRFLFDRFFSMIKERQAHATQF